MPGELTYLTEPTQVTELTAAAPIPPPSTKKDA